MALQRQQRQQREPAEKALTAICKNRKYLRPLVIADKVLDWLDHDNAPLIIRTIAEIAETAAGKHADNKYMPWEDCFYKVRGMYFSVAARDIRSFVLEHDTFVGMPLLRREFFCVMLNEQVDLRWMIYNEPEPDMGPTDRPAREVVREPFDVEKGDQSLGLRIVNYLQASGHDVKCCLADSEWNVGEVYELLHVLQGDIEALEKWGVGAIPTVLIHEAAEEEELWRGNIVAAKVRKLETERDTLVRMMQAVLPLGEREGSATELLAPLIATLKPMGGCGGQQGAVGGCGADTADGAPRPLSEAENAKDGARPPELEPSSMELKPPEQESGPSPPEQSLDAVPAAGGSKGPEGSDVQVGADSAAAGSEGSDAQVPAAEERKPGGDAEARGAAEVLISACARSEEAAREVVEERAPEEERGKGAREALVDVANGEQACATAEGAAVQVGSPGPPGRRSHGLLLDMSGHYRVVIRKDGNCLFRSLGVAARCVELNGKIDGKGAAQGRVASETRARIVAFLADHKLDLVDPLSHRTWAEEYRELQNQHYEAAVPLNKRSYERYLQYMSLAGSWGDGLCLQAGQQAFGGTVLSAIVCENPQGMYRTISPAFSKDRKLPILEAATEGGLHYDIWLPKRTPTTGSLYLQEVGPIPENGGSIGDAAATQGVGGVIDLEDSEREEGQAPAKRSARLARKRTRGGIEESQTRGRGEAPVKKYARLAKEGARGEAGKEQEGPIGTVEQYGGVALPLETKEQASVVV